MPLHLVASILNQSSRIKIIFVFLINASKVLKIPCTVTSSVRIQKVLANVRRKNLGGGKNVSKQTTFGDGGMFTQ